MLTTDPDDLEQNLEAAEAKLNAQATAITSALKLIECVRNRVLPSLYEALGYASGISFEELRKARLSILEAVNSVLEENSCEETDSVPERFPNQYVQKLLCTHTGLAQYRLHRSQSMLTQDRLPDSLEALAITRWGIDWKKQEYVWGPRSRCIVKDDIADPATSVIGAHVAKAVHRIGQCLTGTIPQGYTAHPLLIQAANLVKGHGLEEVEAVIKSWGVTYPPADTKP